MANKAEDIHRKGKPGRKSSLGDEHVRVLRAIVADMPHAALAEVTAELARRCGVQVHPATVRKALRRAGIVRDKPVRRASVQRAEQGRSDPRTGYTAMHRRSSSAEGQHTDLTDAEWALVADLFERHGKQGVPPRYERRTMVNACCYVVRTGAPWRLVPKSYAPWAAVYMCFKRWAAAGTFEAMHERLRQQWRLRAGKSPEPTAAIIDSQSTRSTAQGGNTGFDAGKKVKGRKRNLVVDTLGLVLAVTITAASVQDRDTAADVVAKACAKAPTLKRLYTDAAYAGQRAAAIERAHGIVVEVVRRSTNRVTGTWRDAQLPLPLQTADSATSFAVQPKRWVVERTHAWLERDRRLTLHHDRSNWAPLAWVWLSQARMLATRLAN